LGNLLPLTETLASEAPKPHLSLLPSKIHNSKSKIRASPPASRPSVHFFLNNPNAAPNSQSGRPTGILNNNPNNQVFPPINGNDQGRQRARMESQ
jgi:hypothetical protein